MNEKVFYLWKIISQNLITSGLIVAAISALAKIVVSVIKKKKVDNKKKKELKKYENTCDIALEDLENL